MLLQRMFNILYCNACYINKKKKLYKYYSPYYRAITNIEYLTFIIKFWRKKYFFYLNLSYWINELKCLLLFYYNPGYNFKYFNEGEE